MHTVMFTGGGLILLGLFALFGYLWGVVPVDFVMVAKFFIGLWLVLAITNMWVGVVKYHYSVREELAILLVVAFIPICMACVVAWCLKR